jgi:hypothetical protein
VATLTVQEFTFDLNELDWNRVPSMERVYRTFMDDANRALVWWIRYGAFKKRNREQAVEDCPFTSHSKPREEAAYRAAAATMTVSIRAAARSARPSAAWRSALVSGKSRRAVSSHRISRRKYWFP